MLCDKTIQIIFSCGGHVPCAIISASCEWWLVAPKSSGGCAARRRGAIDAAAVAAAGGSRRSRGLPAAWRRRTARPRPARPARAPSSTPRSTARWTPPGACSKALLAQPQTPCPDPAASRPSDDCVQSGGSITTSFLEGLFARSHFQQT